MPKRKSLYAEHPDYRVDLEPCESRVVVRYQGEVVADSRRALVVRETRHAPVIYLPREDVRLGWLERTDHQSFCPFKGEASYWTLRVGSNEEENVVWSYEDPFDEVMELKDYMSFYTDRVTLEEQA